MKLKMSKEVDLGKEPIGHLLFVLAVPSIISQVVNALYNMVDRMYIGHIPGEGAAALTGLGVCFPIIMIVSAFAALMGMGGAPRASILMGKKDNEGAEKILGNCFSALVITAVVLTALVLVFKRPLLMMFGASENTHRIRRKLSEHLCGWNDFCTADTWTQCIYRRTGLF